MEMNATITGERRVSERDRQYTPHEYEEIRALAKKSRERLQRLALAGREQRTAAPPAQP
jgi:hypothetical protein